MRILHLTLKKKWFDMILSGEKKEEYREIKPYWMNRLSNYLGELAGQHFDDYRHFDAIEFRNGYGEHAPTMLVGLQDMRRGIGRKEWGAPDEEVFILRLDEILETKNINQNRG